MIKFVQGTMSISFLIIINIMADANRLSFIVECTYNLHNRIYACNGHCRLNVAIFPSIAQKGGAQ